MKTNKQQGFTLIELIIVIVILGILAVTASPKFLDLTGDARSSSVSGLEGAIKGASNIIYSKAIIDGKTKTNDDSENVSGVIVVYGYPEATQAALVEAAGLTAGDWEFYVNGSDAKEIRIYPTGNFEGDDSADVSDDTACYVSYTEASTSGGSPTIASATSACGA